MLTAKARVIKVEMLNVRGMMIANSNLALSIDDVGISAGDAYRVRGREARTAVGREG